MVNPVRLRTLAARVALGTLLGVSTLLAAMACESNEREPRSCYALSSECATGAIPSYTNEIAPLIQRRCGGCHTAADPAGPWPFDNYEDVTDWSFTIILTLDECTMPPPDSDVALSEDERQLLNAWLVCGAPPN